MGVREALRTTSSKLLSLVWGQPDWIAITASLAAFLVYLNTLKAGFVYDDSRAILTNPDIRPETPWYNLLHNDFWGTPLENSGSHKSYRPLTTLSFRLNFLLSGLNPWPYHLTNVLLHTLTTWLFVRVARLVFCSKSCMYLNTLCNLGSPSTTTSNSSSNNNSSNNGPFSNHHHHHHHHHSAKTVGNGGGGGGSCQRKGRFTEVTSSRNLAVLLSSLLFALHPIHTEAVAGLVGRADVGCTAFALLSFISYVKFVKFREKARINSVLVKNTRNHQSYYQYTNKPSSSSNNSSRSHSPLCPNKNKKAVLNNQYDHNNHHHHHHSKKQSNPYFPHHSTSSSSSCFNQLTGFGSFFTRFTNILTCFSSFLLVRMKMFVVSKDEGDEVKSISSITAGGMVTTTKASSDNGTTTTTSSSSTVESNGYQKVKVNACDGNNTSSSTTTTAAAKPDVGGASCGVFGVSDSGIVGSVFGRGGSAVICIFWLRCAVWFTVAVGFAAAAMLTKEQGITILLVCATYDLARSLVRTRHLYQEMPSILRLECRWSVLLLALSSLSLLYLRLSLMGPNFAPPVFSKADNSIAHQSSFWVRLGTFLFLPVFNFGLIVFPHPLSYDWSMDAIPPIQSFWELRNLASFSFYAILLRTVFLLLRKLWWKNSQETADATATSLPPFQSTNYTPKRAATNARSRRDFLLLNGQHSTMRSNGSGNYSTTTYNRNGVIAGNFSPSQWWPWSSAWSSSSSCYYQSPASTTSITASGYSGSTFPPSISTTTTATDDISATTYPYSFGFTPNRKDYCNVCHLWMGSGRKQQQQHQHNNNNSIWNDGSAAATTTTAAADDDSGSPPSPKYLDFFGGNEPERDCDDTSSNGSSCSSTTTTSSSSSSNASSRKAYNGLITSGHQGRSNHYRSSGNSPPTPAAVHHQHQNFRYRVTSNGSNISNGFGNGTSSSSTIPLAYNNHYGNTTTNTNNGSSIINGGGGTSDSWSFSTTFSSIEAELIAESTTISRSSEVSSALRCASLLLQLSFLVLPFLPATNLFFYVGFVVAERVLYMPSVGFCLLLGHGFLLVWNRLQCHHTSQNYYHQQKSHHHYYHHHHQKYQRHSRGQGHHHRFSNGGGNTSKSFTSSSSSNGSTSSSAVISAKKQKRLRKVFVASVITSLLVLSLRTLRRNEDWEDEGKLYKAGIQVSPPKSWGNLGIVLSNQGRLKEAEQAYRKALHFRSNLADVHYNLGILLESQGRLDEALESYRSAIHFRPKLAPAYVNAGQVLTRLGRIADAREMYTTCLSISDEGIKDLRNHLEAKTSAYLRLGKLLVEDEDDPRAAIGVYRQAVEVMPSDYSQKQAVYNSLGEALYRNGQPEEAEQWFIKALRTKPDHVPAHLTYGKMLARNKTRLLEAESWFRRAKKIAPADSSVYHHYGQFLSVQGRHSEAAESYVTAANLAPNDYDIIVGAANALRLSGDNAQAELYYKKAVGLRPQEARAHMNYGAILHVNGKYTEATKSYLAALRLKPEDDVTLMNLKKVMAISKSSKSLVLISCQHDDDDNDNKKDLL